MTRTAIEPKLSNAGEMLTTDDAADLIGVKPATLVDWRFRGRDGPAFHRITSRVVRYRRSEIETWLASKRVSPAAAE